MAGRQDKYGLPCLQQDASFVIPCQSGEDLHKKYVRCEHCAEHTGAVHSKLEEPQQKGYCPEVARRYRERDGM